MKDRNVQFANRFRLIKVEGTDDIFDLIPAPGAVTEEGTLINMFALLKDATAELWGFGERLAEAVPDDVLAEAGRLKLYRWKRRRLKKEIVKTAYSGSPTAFTGQRVFYYGTAVIDADINNATISWGGGAHEGAYNYSSTSIAVNTALSNLQAALPGKCWALSNSKPVYYSGPNAVFSADSAKKLLVTDTYTLSVSRTLSAWETVVSADPEAYPHSGYTPEDDGEGGWEAWEYSFLGTAFDALMEGHVPQISSGKYIGTGVYGQDNPNTLTFPFKPELLIVSPANTASRMILVGDATSDVITVTNGSYSQIITWDGNTVSWYTSNGTSAVYQYNALNTVYNYIAFG